MKVTMVGATPRPMTEPTTMNAPRQTPRISFGMSTASAVFAHTTEEVVEIVKLCSADDVPIVPFGAGTSVEGNVTPVRGGISLDLSEMDAILAVNPEDFDCTVQAGVRREQLNEHLRDMGLFFPIDPGANATKKRETPPSVLPRTGPYWVVTIGALIRGP